MGEQSTSISWRIDKGDGTSRLCRATEGWPHSVDLRPGLQGGEEEDGWREKEVNVGNHIQHCAGYQLQWWLGYKDLTQEVMMERTTGGCLSWWLWWWLEQLWVIGATMSAGGLVYLMQKSTTWIVGGSTRRRSWRRLAAKRQKIGTTMRRQNGAWNWLIAGHTCMEKKLNDVKAYSKGWKSKVNASMFWLSRFQTCATWCSHLISKEDNLRKKSWRCFDMMYWSLGTEWFGIILIQSVAIYVIPQPRRIGHASTVLGDTKSECLSFFPNVSCLLNNMHEPTCIR